MRASLILIAAALMLSLAPGAAAETNEDASDRLDEQPGLVKREFIFESAPFPSSHASTIVETHGGLLAAWFGGTDEGEPDVCIWTSRFENGHWTAPVEVANGVQSPQKRYPTWNPVLFQPKVGPLLLFY